MKSAVIYGGGNIGRGFIGQVFYQSGYNVSFIDVNTELLEQLNIKKSYPVRILKTYGYDEILIENVTGIDGNDIDSVSSAIAKADICATAVGVNVLKFIAKPFYEGIIKRFADKDAKPLDIIICENLIGADKFLKSLISSMMNDNEKKYLDKVGFVEASIGRMVPIQTEEMKDGNPLRICAEKYDRLPVDKSAFKGDIPVVENLVPFSPFSYYIERKLFVHNMGHAATAYLGQYLNKDYIYQAINIPEIELIILRAMTASALALSKRYNVDVAPLLKHTENLIYRFSNKALADTVIRVGGDIKRKLSPNDRLIGAFNLCKEQGVDNTFIAIAIAASLLFKKDSEEKIYPEDILKNISLLSPSTSDYKKIMSIYNLFLERKPIKSILSEIKEQQNSCITV